MVWGPSIMDFVPEGLFLGVTFEDWLAVQTAALSRGMTVRTLLLQFEEDHPLNQSLYDHLDWKEHFGVMAEVEERSK